MEKMYQTLKIVYNIAKHDTDPTTYPCTYRDIILNSSPDNINIQQDLDALVNENLILVKKLDCTVFCITNQGIEYISTLEKSLNIQTSFE